MTATNGAVSLWLSQAHIIESCLSADQLVLLRYAYEFRQRCGEDYYSNRLLSHFLLHCDANLKIAQIARLLGISRPTASHQKGVSSKEAIQSAHHRMAGRPHGKMLPRYAGPIAEFILTHADATRYDILDFIERTWGVRVSTVALHHFCKKFGLDRATRAEATAPRPSADCPAPEPRPAEIARPSPPMPLERPAEMARSNQPMPLALPAEMPRLSRTVPLPPPPFSRYGRSTPARSC